MPNPVTTKQSTDHRPIDKEVYLDAQSKGFASRIVKYHQDNASRTSKNVYKTPGDLPIVHLKRGNDLFFKNRRSSSLSNLGRVGRLDRNYGNEDPTRRQVPLNRGLSSYGDTFRHQMPREMHVVPPAMSVDAFSGTRSVLDELKEISRKRINNKFDEELDFKETKKYCKDVISNQPQEGTSGVSSAAASNTKRQRNVSPPVGPGVPQQRVKKICRDSYDVISSLSSSLGLARSKSTIPSSTSASSPTIVYQRPVAGELRPSKTGLDQYSTQILGPLPNRNVAARDTTDTTTPATDVNSLRATASVPLMVGVTEAPTPKSSTVAKEAPKLTLFNKDYKTIPQKRKLEKERDPQSDEDYEEESFGKNPFVKPQESSPGLATRLEEKEKVEKNKLALMLKCLAGDFEDSEEEETPKDVVDTVRLATTASLVPPTVSSAISFAVPQATTVTSAETKSTTAPTTTTSTIEKPKENIVVGITPTVIKPAIDPQPVIAQPTAEENVVKPTPVVVSTATSTEKTGFNSPTAAMFTFNNKSTATVASSPPSSIAPIQSATSSAGFSFGTSPPTLSGVAPIATASVTAAAATPPAYPSSSLPSTASEAAKSSIPGIFSFSKTAPTTSAVTFGNTQPALATKLTEPSKIPVPVLSFGASSLSKPSATVPSFTTTNTFGGTVPASSVAASVAPSVNLNSTFAFGMTPSKDPTPALLPISSAATDSAPKSTFAFGGGQGTSVVTTSTPAPVPSSIPTMFSFGGNSPGTGSTTTKDSAATTAFSGFLSSATSPFGGSSTATAAPVSNAAPVFGGISSSSTTKSFSFGGQDSGAKAAPVFGGVVSPQVTPVFGAATAQQQPSSSPFSFGGGGGSSTTAPANVNPFGGSSATSPTPSATPVFGGGASGTQAPPAFGTQKSAVPTFGGIGVGLGSTAPVFGASQQPVANNNSSSPFSFGGGGGRASNASSDQLQKSSTFSFGGTSSVAAPATGLGNTFNSSSTTTGGGLASAASSPFGFGGSAGNTQSSGSTSVFGGSSTAAAPIFGSSAAPVAASPFGENKANSTFSFGGSGSGVTSPTVQSSNSAFNFSSSSSAPTTNNNGGSAFQFGDTSAKASGIVPSNSFAFGQSSAGQAGAPASGMFNFGGQGDLNASLGGGVGGAPAFNIGTGGGPPRRPIRQATRRLK